MNTEIQVKAAKIKLVIFDVDGVLTDGRLYFAPNGEELKVFYVHDGLGIKLLQEAGITVAIISSRESPIVVQRFGSLGVRYIYQGQADKRPAFDQLLKELKINAEHVAYVGDDLPDLPLIQQAGLGIAVANAQPAVKQHADWQTTLKGGKGAAREVCEFILQAKKAC